MFKECLLFTRPLDLNLQHENIGEENTLFPYLTDSISKNLIIKTSLFKGKKNVKVYALPFILESMAFECTMFSLTHAFATNNGKRDLDKQ